MDMTHREIELAIPSHYGPIRGTLLLQLPEWPHLPMLQVYSAGDRVVLVKRWGGASAPQSEHTSVWLNIDVGRGPLEVVEDRPRSEIEADIRAFFGDDPRIGSLVDSLPCVSGDQAAGA